MNFNKLWFGLAGLVALFLIACEGPRMESESGAFKTLDVNNDGKISPVEYATGMKSALFRQLDANGDKVITWEEWQKLDNSPDARKHFDALDANKDGKITEEEFQKAAGQYSNLDDLFKSQDKNADGFLTRDELLGAQGVKLFNIKF